MMTRRHFLYSGGLGLLGSGMYARFMEPTWLVTSFHQAPFFSSPGPSLRVLHLSDFHYSPAVPLSTIERAIRMGLEQKPDLVCLTGDYMTFPLPSFEAYVKTLKLLTDQVPVYACRGNHDYQSPRTTPVPAYFKGPFVIPPLLQAAGIRLLENEIDVVEIQGRRFQIAGLGDCWRNECFPQKAFSRQLPALPTLVLSHNPDSKSLLEHHSWNLMLCGHTHGGQVKLPFFGAIHAPIEDFNYIEGLNPWKDRWIYTTRGVGNLYGIRFNCRPEVSVLELI